jgi:hypothetical protein
MRSEVVAEVEQGRETSIYEYLQYQVFLFIIKIIINELC